jgi:hypothetical protein
MASKHKTTDYSSQLKRMAACPARPLDMTSMIQVTKTEEDQRTIVVIDAQLSGDYRGAVEMCYKQTLSKGKRVSAFLRDVSTIDQSGRALLSRLAAKGIRLLTSSVGAYSVVGALKPAGTEALQITNPKGMRVRD